MLRLKTIMSMVVTAHTLAWQASILSNLRRQQYIKTHSTNVILLCKLHNVYKKVLTGQFVKSL